MTNPTQANDMVTEAAGLAGLYQLNLDATTGLLGAATVYLRLLVAAPTGKVSGFAQITKPVSPPVMITVQPVTGRLVEFDQSGNRVLFVQGDYTFSFPPPAIGEGTGHFDALVLLDSNFEGYGDFVYLGDRLDNVPVKRATS